MVYVREIFRLGLRLMKGEHLLEGGFGEDVTSLGSVLCGRGRGAGTPILRECEIPLGWITAWDYRINQRTQCSQTRPFIRPEYPCMN